MTPAQYAKHRGVSRQYIHKLIKAGKLTMLDGEIDPALADAELEMARAQSSHGPKGGPAASSKAMDDYRRAVTRCANARAEALETANRTKKEDLVSRSKVEEYMANREGAIRNSVMGIVRVTAQVYDAPSLAEAAYRLDMACGQALGNLTGEDYQGRARVPVPPLVGAYAIFTADREGNVFEIELGQEGKWLRSRNAGWEYVDKFYDRRGQEVPEPHVDVVHGKVVGGLTKSL